MQQVFFIILRCLTSDAVEEFVKMAIWAKIAASQARGIDVPKGVLQGVEMGSGRAIRSGPID